MKQLQKILKLLFFTSLFSMTLFSKDLNIDKIIANADGKPLFLFFHKPHCGHCKHMITFTLSDPEIKKEIDEKFVFVDIYTKESGNVSFKDFTGSRRAFAKHLGYDFYPSSIFLDANSKLVNATPGAREQDFFINVLNYVSNQKYKEMEFETYLDTLDFNSDM